MPIAPEDYSSTPVAELLAAAARGHVMFDRRLAVAILARPGAMGEVLDFAAADRSGDRFDISEELMWLIAARPAPDALPFLMSEIRRYPEDLPDAMTEALVRIGTPSIEPLLAVHAELAAAGSPYTGDVLFHLAAVGRGDPRVATMVEAIREADPEEYDLMSEMMEESAEEPPPLDVASVFDEQAEPELDHLPEDEIEEFFESGSARMRERAVRYFVNAEITPSQRDCFLRMAESDPDTAVRAAAWEALRDVSDEPGIRKAMFDRLESESLDGVERAGLACALAYEASEPRVRAAIEAAYADPATRATAVEAMWRSLDRAWAPRAVAHLDDPDLAVRREAVTAVGYLRIRSEAQRLPPLFDDLDLRHHAIHAYLLVAPADETRFGIRQLEKRVEQMAGGFDEEDKAVATDAVELRFALAGHGRAPAGKTDPQPAAAAKAGRNDPCPCGSGKKYKKCCGA